MPAKRILYFTSSQVGAYTWKSGVLTQDAVFDNGEATPPEFETYIATEPNALYFLLVDIVEEDFHQETIPYVRGGDRSTLLHRKLAQRYRDLSLALTLSLGYESGPRKEESILFASFTNTQQLQPWLLTLSQKEARVVGVYSVPLLAPAVIKKLGFTQKRFLLVSRQQAGIRQSFVDNGQIRFSRLGQIEGDDMAVRAHALAAETSRLQQYLVNMRMLTRDGGPLDVIVLSPDESLAQFQAACANTAQLTYTVLSIGDACKRAGLKGAPAQLLAERLFLHILATSKPGQQFAVDEHRRFYNVWRARIATYATGAAVFAACALLAGVKLLDFYGVQSQASSDQQQERRLNDQYARLQAQFPKTPASTENLKALVKNYIQLQRQSVSIDKILVEISRALTAVPQIEIERIEWQIGASPGRTPAQPGTGAPPPPPPAAAAGDKGDSDPLYEVVQLNGIVNAAQASDFRNITRLVNQFTDALRARPGVEVTGTQLPFDLTAEKSISGDIGAAREAQIPRFTITFNRRVQS
jgi:hypothetical protein